MLANPVKKLKDIDWKSYTNRFRDWAQSLKPGRYAITPEGMLVRIPDETSSVVRRIDAGDSKKIEGTGNIQTGGRNNLSVDEYFRQEAEASKMYDSIRVSTSDVQAISKNTGIAESRIQRIKDHVFNNEHIKSSGNGRFDPDYEIAQAWTRLQQGTYNKKDIDLLNHELFESRFEGIFKTNYETAHDAAVRSGRPWEID